MKLLIVEDSKLVAERLCAALSTIPDLALDTARNFTTASERLRAWQPQAVILDIQLGDGNGLELLRTIKREQPDTRVLMFSNHPYFRAYCVKAGAEAFFDKANEFEALTGTVRQMAGSLQ